MQDPLDVYQQMFTCHFCQTKLSDAVKLIPDCGNFICGACYTKLDESLDRSSKRYKCDPCGGHHVLPENGLVECKQFASLSDHPVENPLSDEAKNLKELIENVQYELSRLETFDPRDHIEQHCVQLEHEVSQAAESAIKHIKQIEARVQKQIQEYRQRCLDELEATSLGSDDSVSAQTSINATSTNKTGVFAQEISEFSAKWSDYFKRLDSLASDNQVEDAIHQTTVFQDRMRELDKEIRNRALGDTLFPSDSFCSVQSYLDELAELPTKYDEIRIQETATTALIGHSELVHQTLFLSDNRLASCSSDKTIKVWDTASGKVLFTLRGHTGKVYSLAILPNGWLATGSGDKTIKLWSLGKRGVVRTLRGHTSSVASLQVLSIGNLVSYSSDDSIKIWNPYLTKNNLLLTITGHGNKKWLIPFGILPNDLLVACSRDREDTREESTLRVWNPHDGRLVKSLPTGLKSVWPIVALSNDQIAIGTVNGTIKIIDLDDQSKTRTKARAHVGNVCCLLKLSNENLVSAGHDLESSALVHSIKVWDVSDLTILQHVESSHSLGILSLGVSADGKMLASGDRDKTIRLWPIKSIKNDETNSQSF